MAKYDIRLKAREYRRKGFSIKSIANFFKVSRSSASIWCRDMQLTDKQKLILKNNAILAGHKGRLMGSELNHRKKIEMIDFYNKEAKEELGGFSKRDLLIAGASLYWAEGSKNGNRFIFVNSDPQMIKLMSIFIKKILKIKSEYIKPVVQINKVHENRIEAVMRYWSSLLELPLSQFGKPYFIKTIPKKVYDNHDSYFGILRLVVAKGSKFQYKMLGLIKAIKDQI